MPFAFSSSLPLAYGAARAFRNCTIALIVCAFSAQAEPVTVVALGDSLTAGYGLPADQGLVPQLQGWLAAKGADVMLVNAGVSGDTTAGGLSRLDWSLTPDVDALIVTLGGNDLLRGIDPATSRANLDGILQGAASRNLPVLLVPMAAPGNYGPDYQAAFDAIYPDLAAQYGALLTPPFFEPLRPARDAGDMALFMQADGIHPNKDGVAQIVSGLGPHVLALVAKVPPAP